MSKYVLNNVNQQIKVLVLRQSIFKHPCKQKSRSYKGLQATQYGHSQTGQPELYYIACWSAEHLWFCGTFTAMCVSLISFIINSFGHEDSDLILFLSFTSHMPAGATSGRGLGDLLIHSEPAKSSQLRF